MDDDEVMRRAMELAADVRGTTAPNPWVGCVIESPSGVRYEGATAPPSGPHAEAAALAAAGADATGGTAWVTLEPCAHHGRTPPCADALIAAGIRRVVVALEDPDPRVAGRGIAALREAGVEVEVGVEADAVRRQLAPYLKQRATGRPYVVLKLAATLDGRIAAPDGSSQWITGGAARADSHQLRAESDAIVVGAGTVRADDPSLTVRDAPGRDPLRVVLGTVAPEARVHPALEFSGPIPDLLDDLGRRGVLQVMVEGGATVAAAFHQAGLVDRYVVYLAPALFGGDDAVPMFAGTGAPTMADVWRGRLVEVAQLGDDVRIDVEPAAPTLHTGQVPVVAVEAETQGAR
ncbi:MAG TPA: bifunctional diaminohydroxyphosphoribosylaminopyrimidine deaminase/5-amino-6-(5-phosphoribosylamino)uracil reductase RibD [Acidimicrobiales bacterium]